MFRKEVSHRSPFGVIPGINVLMVVTVSRARSFAFFISVLSSCLPPETLVEFATLPPPSPSSRLTHSPWPFSFFFPSSFTTLAASSGISRRPDLSSFRLFPVVSYFYLPRNALFYDSFSVFLRIYTAAGGRGGRRGERSPRIRLFPFFTSSDAEHRHTGPVVKKKEKKKLFVPPPLRVRALWFRVGLRYAIPLAAYGRM